MGDLIPLPARAAERDAWHRPAAPSGRVLHLPRHPVDLPPHAPIAALEPVAPAPRLDPYRPFPLGLDIALGLAGFGLFCGLVGALVVGLVELWRATA